MYSNIIQSLFKYSNTHNHFKVIRIFTTLYDKINLINDEIIMQLEKYSALCTIETMNKN